jgi:Icc-related predicted phosphoesterase
MTALVIADDDSAINQLPENRADVLISLGDVLELSMNRAAARCGCRNIVAVKGNHDSASPFAAPVVDLHLKTFEFGGLRFGGFGGSWKYKPRGHHLFEQHEVESALRTFPKVDVFVAHNSPLGIHDIDDEVHTGFAAFLPYIEKHQPKLFFHGHQHVSKETQLGKTKIVGVFGFKFFVIDS